MATFNSQPNHLRRHKLVFLMLLALGVLSLASAEDKRKIFAARAENEFHRAQNQFQSNTNNSTNAWQFARACFDWCEFATNDTQRADIAKLGIAACKQLIERESNSAPGHYYLAMDFGELAQAEAPSIAAYRLVKEIEREFKTAIALDETFDFAGAVRSLGLLYRDAPGWPISIGSKRKAREWLERAVALAPDYPENRLSLAESLLRWKERDEALKELNALDDIWSKAQKQFTGEAWEQNWDDWTTRRDALRAKLDEFFKNTKPAREK